MLVQGRKPRLCRQAQPGRRASRRQQADQLAVALVGEHIEQAVWAFAHVADALPQVFEQALLGQHARALELGLDIRAAEVLSPFDAVHVDKFAREYERLRAHKGVTFRQAADTVTDVGRAVAERTGSAVGAYAGLVDKVLPGHQEPAAATTPKRTPARTPATAKRAAKKPAKKSATRRVA